MSGPEKENACSPTYNILVADTMYCRQSADWIMSRVVGDRGNCVGEVRRAHSVMNRMHHGAQFVLDALVYRQSVQLTKGRGRMVTRSLPKYETRSCILYAL